MNLAQHQSPLTTLLYLSVPVSRPVFTLTSPRMQAMVGDVVELHCESQRGSPPILYRFYHENVILGSSSVPSGTSNFLWLQNILATTPVRLTIAWGSSAVTGWFSVSQVSRICPQQLQTRTEYVLSFRLPAGATFHQTPCSSASTWESWDSFFWLYIQELRPFLMFFLHLLRWSYDLYSSLY